MAISRRFQRDCLVGLDVLAPWLQAIAPPLASIALLTRKAIARLPNTKSIREAEQRIRELQARIDTAVADYIHQTIDNDIQAYTLWSAARELLETFPLQSEVWQACRTAEQAVAALFSNPTAETCLRTVLEQQSQRTDATYIDASAVHVKTIIQRAYDTMLQERSDLYGMEARIIKELETHAEVLVAIREALHDIAQTQASSPVTVEAIQHALDQLDAIEARALLQLPYHADNPAASARRKGLLMASSANPVPLWGREALLDHLQQWCNAEPAVAIRSYAAKGGSGKTRLLLELCQRLDTAESPALAKPLWRAGFLQTGDHPSKLYRQLCSLDHPLLIVVDYAEREASSQLEPLLNALYAHDAGTRDAVPRPHAKRIRIVLLTRDVSPYAMPQNPLREIATHPIFSYYDTIDSRPLPTLGDSKKDRLEFLLHAANHFAKVLDLPSDDIAELCAQQDLSPDYLQRPLYLQITALCLLEQGSTTSPKQETELLDYVIAREYNYLRNAVDSTQEARVWHGFILFTAAKPLSEDAARALLARTPLLQDAAENTLHQIEALLHRIYGAGKEHWIAPLLPDLVLEQLYGNYLPKQSYSPQLLKLLLNDEAMDTQAVLTHLDALAQRSENAAVFQDKACAAMLHEAIPHPTVLLRQLAVVTCQQLYQQSTEDAERARWLQNSSVRLGDVGRHQEALENSEQAVKIYQELADDLPAAYLPEFAGSLNNLSNHLSQVGRLQEALENIEQAVAIYQHLADAQPDAYLPDLARSLHNLSIHLGEVGRYQEALAKIEQAVAIYQHLADAQPDAYLPDLVHSLLSHAFTLLMLEQAAQALSLLSEALERLAPYYQKYPQAFYGLAKFASKRYVQCCHLLGRAPDAALLAPFEDISQAHHTEG